MIGWFDRAVDKVDALEVGTHGKSLKVRGVESEPLCVDLRKSFKSG